MECIIPMCEELNYETSQVKCPHSQQDQSSEKCQKVFKNIMALNVHLQMYHRETGIITASNRYTSRVGRYHCPVEHCSFQCCCENDPIRSLSFSNFNAVRLHYLRQHGVKKEQCSKCFKSFGLHQDLVAHEKICGVHCPFSCSHCNQHFQNRTSLRRHQLKCHTTKTNDCQSISFGINLPSACKPIERRERPNRRRPLPPDQIELSRQNNPSSTHSSVTINPFALALLRNFNSESTSNSSASSTIDLIPPCESDSDKATQTYTRVSVGTECCSLINSVHTLPQLIPMKATEQKSSQTTSRLRMRKKRARCSFRKPSSLIDNDASSSSTTSFSHLSLNPHNQSSATMRQWENVHVTDMETQISSPLYSDMCIQTVGVVSNLLDYPSQSSDHNHNVIIQTLPIAMTSTQVQTNNEYSLEQSSQNYSNYLSTYQESVGTSCFFDDFLLDDISKHEETESSSAVLFDLDAIDLLDLIDSGTQTNPSTTTHDIQTSTDWDNMLLTGDEWIQNLINS